jgi:chitin disaccharide deacetylase
VGALIINADDWGKDVFTTDRIAECVARETVSSVSAMVLMQDSERASAVARERGMDVGLHLNLTEPFSAEGCPARLKECQQRIASYLRRYHPLSTIVFHPGLARSFEYVVKAQREEFHRLYGHAPRRIDGHHHMHLCSNVLVTGLLPRGTIIRRNFSFRPGEKRFYNRLYRNALDRILARNHRLTDFFFSIEPLEEAGRLRKIASLARSFVVEVGTHPARPKEYDLLMDGTIFRLTGNCPIAAGFPTSPDEQRRN